jgi:hypothetical protein
VAVAVTLMVAVARSVALVVAVVVAVAREWAVVVRVELAVALGVVMVVVDVAVVGGVPFGCPVPPKCPPSN